MIAENGLASHARVLLSIHDVMPETLDRVEDLLDVLDTLGPFHPDLLVVPGKDWQPADIQRLRGWLARGCRLAGHGWEHHCDGWGGLYHRLHGAFFSRNVAEHLMLDRKGVEKLLCYCFSWFEEQSLPLPQLYVPPAWTMGRIARKRLRILPFRYYEYFGGIYDSREDRFHRLPLVGYEADTPFRRWAVRNFNRWNRLRARFNKPLRIGLHPQDLHLLLADDLRRDLGQIGGQSSVIGDQ